MEGAGREPAGRRAGSCPGSAPPGRRSSRSLLACSPQPLCKTRAACGHPSHCFSSQRPSKRPWLVWKGASFLLRATPEGKYCCPVFKCDPPGRQSEAEPQALRVRGEKTVPVSGPRDCPSPQEAHLRGQRGTDRQTRAETPGVHGIRSQRWVPGAQLHPTLLLCDGGATALTCSCKRVFTSAPGGEGDRGSARLLRPGVRSPLWGQPPVLPAWISPADPPLFPTL